MSFDTCKHLNNLLNMSDIFKSALDYFSSSFSAEDNDYVGSNVELGNVKLKIKRLVAEGES